MASKFIGDHQGDGTGLSNVTAVGTSTTGAYTQHTTPNGSIQLGPMNGSWSHIYTTANTNFYFNKDLYVLGNRVWHTGNDDAVLVQGGDIGTTDWNTLIDGTEASWNTVLNHSGANRPSGAYTYGTALSFSKAGQAKLQIYAPETASDGAANGGIWYRTGWNTSYRQWVKLWDSANDGSGSGLDADLLDGIQGSSFLRSDVEDQMNVRLNLDTPADYDNTVVTGLTNAPLYYPEVNVGTANAYLPALHMRSLHSGGYRTHMNVGLFKQASAWGEGETGLYIALGGNDNYPTEEFRFAKGGYMKHSSGNLRVTGNLIASGDVTAYSDARLKSDIVTIEGALDKVSAMRGVMYTKDGKPSTGVIAQEVEAVLPEVVHTAEDEMGTKSVAYGNMVGLLIEGMKEMKEMIEAQQAKINELEDKLNGK